MTRLCDRCGAAPNGVTHVCPLPNSASPANPDNWREWLFGLARGWHGLVGENTHRAQAIIDHICSLDEDTAHQSERRAYWKARAEKAEAIVRDIANSGCECARAAMCDLCGKPLVDCSGGDLERDAADDSRIGY